MENNGNIALGVGVILLLLNVGVGVSGVLDGVIEGNVETAVKDGYDGLDDDGNEEVFSNPGVLGLELDEPLPPPLRSCRSFSCSPSL